MSSRQVKRLLQQQAQAQAAAGPGPDLEEAEEEGPGPTAAPFNPFDLLSDNDDVADERADDVEDAGDVATGELLSSVPQKPSNTAAATQRGSKKKKKQNKGKGKTSGPDQGGQQSPGTTAAASDSVDDVDRLVEQLQLTTVGALQTSEDASTSAPAIATLLGVDPRALRGDDELRRIFGASVIQAVDREDLADAAQRRRQAAAMRGRGGAAALRRALKKGVLVAPKEHWPPFEGGLGMELLSQPGPGGRKEFAYTWSPTYRMHQAAFERCQASYDPNAIAGLLQQAPYHVDALLAMYDLYRSLGENQHAEESLSRALYALEMAWHPEFDIRAANCRLSFEEEENRGLFMALFKHVQALSRAGCHRTALELVKLLLALDPEDPLGATCLLDSLAICAGKFQFLADFVAGFEPDQSLALRPNFSYALPLAALRQQQDAARLPGSQGQGSEQEGGSHACSAGMGEQMSPQQMLTQAILLHPSVVPRILAKLQDKGTGREPHWATLLARPLFSRPHDAGSSSLQHLGAIYAERSALLWKAPDALELLRTAATAAADIAEGGSRRTGTAAGSEGGASQSSPAVGGGQDWACVRREAFPDDHGRNEWRHLRLADFSDAVNALPRDELQAAMGAGPGGGADARPGAGGGLVLPPPMRGDPGPAALQGGPGGPRGAGRRGPVAGPLPAGWEGGLPQGLEGLDEETLMELQEQLLAMQQVEAFQQQQQPRQGAGTGEMPAVGPGREQAGGGGAAGLAPAAVLPGANPVLMMLRSMLPWVNVGQQPDYDQDRDPPRHDGPAQG